MYLIGGNYLDPAEKEALIRVCKTLCSQNDMPEDEALTVEISNSLRTTAGRCYYSDYRKTCHIKLNLKYYYEFGYYRIEKTLRHELAHYYCNLNYGNIGHHKQFKMICNKFKGSMNTAMAGKQYAESATIEYLKTRPKYIYTCPNCHQEYKYKKSMKMNNRICQCGTSIHLFHCNRL